MALLRQCLEMVRAAHGAPEPPPLASRESWHTRGAPAVTAGDTRLADSDPSNNYAQRAASIRLQHRQMRQPSN